MLNGLHYLTAVVGCEDDLAPRRGWRRACKGEEEDMNG